MSDEHLIDHSPFDKVAKPAESDNHADKTALAVRIGFGSKPESESPKQEKPAETAPAKDKPSIPDVTIQGEQKKDRVASRDLNAPVERASESTTQKKIETGSIYEIQKLLTEVQNLQKAMVAACYDQQPDGTLKMKTGKVSDGRGGMVDVSALQGDYIGKMSQDYETAVNMADKSMKEPNEVIGATMSTAKRLEAINTKTQELQQELAAKGINPAVGNILDSGLVTRYLEEHKELNPQTREKLSQLGDALKTQTELQNQFRDLRIMQETPIVTRQLYAEFLGKIGLPNAANEWMNEAKKTSDALNSPVGRSEFMTKQIENAKQAKDDSLDKLIQDKYLKNPDSPFPLLESANKKAAAGDLAGARADMEAARVKAAKGFPDAEKDGEAIKAKADQLVKDREVLAQRLKDGVATPNEVRLQQEKELKIVNEANILDAFRLAKPNVNIAYADFLLNADKDKDSESNRKTARDILMNIRFDDNGKAAAAKQGERFDQLLEQSLNGSLDNRASMVAFNKLMQEHDELKKKAATEKDDKDVAKDFALARKKAEEAAKIASTINRDGADGNEKIIKSQLQKKIDAELAKPAAEQDQGKIKLLQAVMKPSNQMSAQEKEMVAGLTEMMKENGDQKAIDKLAATLKDKSALFDAVSGYSMIQQMEFQKQALNQARVSMLYIDVAMQKGENNPLMAQIEHDKYGADMISQLNSLPGTDGRTHWGDLKEATREKGWGESVWNWCKGTLKEVAISLASWGVGIAAGVGAAALFSWTGPGAIVGGGAVGFAAGAATGSAIRKFVFGDKVTLLSAGFDGISGMTGGVMGTTYAVARGVGTAAVENVIAQQAEKGIVIGAGQTGKAFMAAGMADKFRIALGGSPFLASFSAATAGSVASRYPTEALVGNYDNAKDWAIGSTEKVLMDMPTNLVTAYFGAKVGAPVESKILANGGNLYQSALRQSAKNFLWSSPDGRNMFGRPNHTMRRSEFNKDLYDYLIKPEGDQGL